MNANFNIKTVKTIQSFKKNLNFIFVCRRFIHPLRLNALNGIEGKNPWNETSKYQKIVRIKKNFK
jgi:hypothetical protein